VFEGVTTRAGDGDAPDVGAPRLEKVHGTLSAEPPLKILFYASTQLGNRSALAGEQRVMKGLLPADRPAANLIFCMSPGGKVVRATNISLE
jgi:hypothetical protein